MAFSKASQFPKPHADQSFWSKALAHPARIIILIHLLENGITPFQVLRKKIPLAPTTVSQHLRQLRQSNLIEASEQFPHTYYKINQAAIFPLAVLLNELNLTFLFNK